MGKLNEIFKLLDEARGLIDGNQFELDRDDAIKVFTMIDSASELLEDVYKNKI